MSDDTTSIAKTPGGSGRTAVTINTFTTRLDDVQKALIYGLFDAGARPLVNGSIPPPYNPDTLSRIATHSSILPQNLQAYAVNIDGFGHTFMPKFDPSRDDMFAVVENAIIIETGKRPARKVVEARMQLIEDAMRRELANAQSWFDFCCTEESFTSLRKRTRIDLETTGNAYWEIVRDQAGQLQEIRLLPVNSIELTALGAPVEVTIKVQITPISIRDMKRFRRFRRFVARQNASADNAQQAALVSGAPALSRFKALWYKEHGDPRTMSNRTGIYYENDKALARAEPDASPAMELRHWKLYASENTPYGIPRWIGGVLAIQGTRSAEEVNWLYFENKSVPPLAILVSGGTVTEETLQHLKDVFENDIQGAKNFHRVLLLQAQGQLGSGAGEAKIEMKPLTSAQQKDAQFLEYLSRNSQIVGSIFRLPPLYRGEMSDFNRATAETAVATTEGQVFQPERNEFDWVMNRFFLPELGIVYWTFKTLGPETTDFEVRAKALREATETGALTPNEYRARFGQLYENRELDPIAAEWADRLVMPMAVALAYNENTNGYLKSVPTPAEIDAEAATAEADRSETAASREREAANREATGEQGGESKPEGEGRNGKGKPGAEGAADQGPAGSDTRGKGRSGNAASKGIQARKGVSGVVRAAPPAAPAVWPPRSSHTYRRGGE